MAITLALLAVLSPGVDRRAGASAVVGDGSGFELDPAPRGIEAGDAQSGVEASGAAALTSGEPGLAGEPAGGWESGGARAVDRPATRRVLVVPAFDWPGPFLVTREAVDALMAAAAARLGRMSHGALTYDWVVGYLTQMDPDPDDLQSDDDGNWRLLCAGEFPDGGLNDMAWHSLHGEEPALPYTLEEFDLIVFYWEWHQTCTNYSASGAQQGGGVWSGRSWHRPDGHLVWVNGHDDLTWTRLIALAEGVPSTDGLYCGAQDDVAPPSACVRATGSNPFDLLNPASPYETERAHPPVITKARLGWLPDSSIAVPRLEQWSEFRLSPMEADSGLRAVRVPSLSGDEFWIEYRRPIGDDQHLGAWPNVGHGVQVYRVPSGGGAAQLLDFGTGTKGTDIGSFRDATLAVGQDWFQDSGIAIRVVAAGPGGATVAVYRPSHRPGPSDVIIDGNISTGHVRVAWTPPDTAVPLSGYEVRFEAQSLTSPLAHDPIVETIFAGPEESATDVSVTFPMLPRALKAEVTAVYEAPGPRTVSSGQPAERNVMVRYQAEPLAPWEPGDEQIEFQVSQLWSDPLLQAPNGPVFLWSGPDQVDFGPVTVPGQVAVPVYRSGALGFHITQAWSIGSSVFMAVSGTSATVVIAGGAGSLDRPMVEYEPLAQRTTVSWAPASDPSVSRYRVLWSDVLVGHGWSEVEAPLTSLEIPGDREGSLTVLITALDEDGRIVASSAPTEALTEATPVIGIAPTQVPEGAPGRRTVNLEFELEAPAVTRGIRLVLLNGQQCSGFGIVPVGPTTTRFTVPVTITGDSQPGPGSACHALSVTRYLKEVRLLGTIDIVDDD